MPFTKTDIGHLDEICRILETTISDFKERKINMWQKGYPNRTVIEDDIRSGNSFVYLIDGKVAGYGYINYGTEEFQNTLRGTWEGKNPTVLHRLLVNPDMRRNGIGMKIIEYWENDARTKGYDSLRTETDETNLPMRALMSKNGIMEKGFLTFDNSDKLGFEKIL